MKRISLLFLLCICFVICNGQQQTLPANWTEYRIPNVCSFAIPPTMELRDMNSQFGKVHKALHESPYWEWVCNECDLFNGDFDLAFQPKGINKMDITEEDPFATYARILINFKRIPNNELNQLALAGLTAQDISLFSEYQKSMMEDRLECLDEIRFGNMIGKFEWNPIKIQNIDGLLCLVYDFKRPGRNAQTHVRSYEFYTDNHMIEFIISYNTNDSKLYQQDFDRFINYLKFEDAFKQNRYKPSVSSIANNRQQTYVSIPHNIKYEYDDIEYQTEKIINAPHMLLKLQSSKDDTRSITLAAFGELDLSGYNAHHTDVVAHFQLYDKEMVCSRNGESTTLVESCKKVIIGNNIKSIRSVIKMTSSTYEMTMYIVLYRFVNGSELQTLNIFLSKDDYAHFYNIEQSFTKGLSIIE